MKIIYLYLNILFIKYSIKKLIFSCVFIITGSSLFAQNQIITMEDFEQNTRNWPVNNSIAYQSYFKGGKYYIKNKKSSERYFYLPVYINPSRDYTIELIIKQIAGSNQSPYGLIWGYLSPDDHFDFLITTDGSKEIVSFIKGKKTSLVEESTIQKGIIKPKDANILRVEKTQGEITYFVNNQEVGTSKDVLLLGPKVGFRIPKSVTLEIDQLKVSYEKRQINLIENYQNNYKLENLGPNINSENTEIVPVISPDGNTIYINKRHPDNVGGDVYADIWYSQKDENGEWTPAKNIGKPLNNAGHNFVISVTPDGNTLLIANTYKFTGQPLGSGVSLSVKRKKRWKLPVKQEIKNYVNKNKYVNYFLTTDGTKLIMSIENKNAIGVKDLFISFLEEDNTWSEPQNMGNVINTYADDFSPFMAADNKTLYFASYGHPGYGSSDIFVSRRLDDTWLNWSEPKNLGPEINTKDWEAYYSLSARGDEAYLVSNNPKISMGKEDIFRIKIAESARPDPVAIIQGRVFNQKTNKPIEAEIFYENLITHKQEGKAYSSVDDGYKIALPKGSSYGFRAESKGFFAVSENINLDSLAAFTEKEVNLYLVPIEKGQTFRLNNIFFDTNKATLREESFPELKRLLELLKTNTALKIEIGGHTDSQGTDANNLELSNNRAKVVVDYLTNQGISHERLTYKGFGESKPVASNQTEEGRQLNRRVEFIIR